MSLSITPLALTPSPDPLLGLFEETPPPVKPAAKEAERPERTKPAPKPSAAPVKPAAKEAARPERTKPAPKPSAAPVKPAAKEAARPERTKPAPKPSTSPVKPAAKEAARPERTRSSEAKPEEPAAADPEKEASSGDAPPTTLDLPVPHSRPRFRRTDWRTMPIHKLAKSMPEASESDKAQLEMSLGTKGFNPDYPIFIFEGAVLEGRTRMEICRKLSVEPIFVHYDGAAPEEFVYDANIARRQMTLSQRAWAAAMLLEHLARNGSRRGSKAYQAMLEMLSQNTARRNIQRAGKITRGMVSEELREHIASGRITIAAGELIAELTPDEQYKLEGMSPKAIAGVAAKLRLQRRKESKGRKIVGAIAKAAPEVAACRCEALVALCPYAEDFLRHPDEIYTLLDQWAERWNSCGADFVVFGWRNTGDMLDVIPRLKAGLSRYSYEHMIHWFFFSDKAPRLPTGFRACSQPMFVFRRLGCLHQISEPPAGLFYQKNDHLGIPPDVDHWIWTANEEQLAESARLHDVVHHLAHRPQEVVLWLTSVLARPASKVVACWTHHDALAPARNRFPETEFIGWQGSGGSQGA